MKAKFRTAKSAFAAAIVVCLSGTAAQAVDNPWTGATSGDWNTATNWSLGRVPANPNGAPTGDNFDDALVNVQTPNIATITANISATPRDIKVGLGEGSNGRVDHIAGNAGTGPGNWMYVAHGGGTGIYNLADTTGTGGVLTGYALGSGNMTTDRLWVGGVSWWAGGNGIVNINTSGTWNMNDLAIGINGGTGVVNVDAGTLNTVGWNFIGKNDGGGNGTGTLNMSGGTLNNTGRTYLGQAACKGTLNLSGGSYINANNEFFTVGDGAGGVAELNITNSASLLQCNGEFWVGNDQSVGTMTLSAGTVNTNSWTCIARAGGTATATMEGGTWNKTGGGNFLVGDNSAGEMYQSGGDLTVNGEFWVGENGASNGKYYLSGGTNTVNNWVAVGRNNGTGLVAMTGGTWTKVGNGNFIVGASGPGTMTQSDGLVDVQGGITWVAEGNNCTGTLTISGDAEFRTSRFVVGVYGGTTGTLNLDGGTVRTGQISGGDGNDTVHFNGSQIIATGHQPAFIGGLNTAAVDAGGLKVDSNGFDLTVSQALSGTGGVVKSGTGTLVLDGPNTYAGGNIVANGTLVLTTAATGGGDILVADGATLGVRQTTQASGLAAVNATFGDEGASNLDFDLGNILGNPVVAPLDVTGTLTLNGAVTVNIADSLPSPGTVFLVSYAGPKDGPGAFVLGDLPEGMSATLNDDGTGLVSLTVTSVSLPVWTGDESTVWDIENALNWRDGVTGEPSTYSDLAPVLFDDSASDSLVDLDLTVEPGKVTFDNSVLGYTLDGGGKITGTGTLTKRGSAPLEMWLTGNDYTGVTTLAGGTVTVAALANGGSPSSLGAASADPANLVLAGATLNYAGGNASTNRGFTINGNGTTIQTAADLTISGPVACITGNLTKTGAGNLTLSHPGANVLGKVNPGLQVSGGTLILSGSGTQTNAVAGEMFVGPVPNVPAHLELDATTLNVESWIAVGRGNGDQETVSTLTATDSTIVSGNFSAGWDNGLPNDSTQHIILTRTTWTNNGASQLAESANATSTMTLTDSSYRANNFRAAIGTGCQATIELLGDSTVTSNGASLFGEGTGAKVNMTVGGTSLFVSTGEFLTAMGADSETHVTIQDEGEIRKTGGWFAIGNSNNGVATMTVKNSGKLWSNNDFNIGDVGTSTGTLYLMDSATVTSVNIAFIGKNTGTNGTIIQTGGTFNGESWIPIGRYPGAVGLVEVSNGVFNQTNTGQALIVGEEGTGTLTVKDNGAVVSSGFVLISNAGSGVGVVNLDGGTFTARRITEGAGGAGSGTFNFNGGKLIAGANADPEFMTLVDTVNVMAGGALIDTNGQSISIQRGLLDGDGGGGGLTKSGAGTLFLNGLHDYTGATTVTAGTLAGTGDFLGPIVVQSGANLNPGVTAGTLVATAATFETDSTLTIDLGPVPDTLQADTLDISGAALVLNGTPTLPEYVVARYTTLTGTFATEPALPDGYTLNYNHTANGFTEIAITRPLTAFETWAKANITDIDPGADATPGGDPDGDGRANIVEFALDDDPLSGTASGKVKGQIAAVGGVPTLVLTLPVRSGAVFNGATEQVSEPVDGLVYKIQGSDDLATWTLAISEVLGADKGLIEGEMPPLTNDGGWTYRTFQSPGAVADDPADFLRAAIVTE